MFQVRLSSYDNAWFRPERSIVWRLLWHFAGSPLLRCELLTSSAFRTWLLRAFGAQVGPGVVMRHSFKVKYPWHLVIGSDCWIGEECWIDNLTTVTLGNNVCISQGVYICTGNHDWTDPAFGLKIAPVRLEDGSWAGAKCILAPGAVLQMNAVAAAGSVISGVVPQNCIFAGNPAVFVKKRSISTRVKPDQAEAAL